MRKQLTRTPVPLAIDINRQRVRIVADNPSADDLWRSLCDLNVRGIAGVTFHIDNHVASVHFAERQSGRDWDEQWYLYNRAGGNLTFSGYRQIVPTHPNTTGMVYRT